jgi:Subtilase family
LGKRKDGSVPQNFNQLQPRIASMPGTASFLDAQSAAAWRAAWRSVAATAEALDMTLADVPALNALAEDAPLIGIIDSGVNDHPFLADIVAGAIGVPADLGTADVWGHGTCVAGVAVYGDLRAQLAANELRRGARVCSAKVVNDQGQFDDRRLVLSQMREAIMTLNRRFGCRIFVIALGERRGVYNGGKVGTWAATLDELARELDVVIVVSHRGTEVLAPAIVSNRQ